MLLDLGQVELNTFQLLGKYRKLRRSSTPCIKYCMPIFGDYLAKSNIIHFNHHQTVNIPLVITDIMSEKTHSNERTLRRRLI